MKGKKCKEVKDDGTACKAWAQAEKDYCLMHDPEMEEEHKLICQKGGQTPKRNFNPLPVVKLDEPKDVVNLLADTINKVRTGEIDLRVANCIGYLSGHLTKAFEVTQLHQRVELIEKVVLSR